MPRRQKTFSIDLSPSKEVEQAGNDVNMTSANVASTAGESTEASEEVNAKKKKQKRTSRRASKRASLQPNTPPTTLADLQSSGSSLSVTESSSEKAASKDNAKTSNKAQPHEADGFLRSAEGRDPIAWEPEASVEVLPNVSTAQNASEEHTSMALAPRESEDVFLAEYDEASAEADSSSAEAPASEAERKNRRRRSRASGQRAHHVPRVLVANPISKVIGHWYDRLSGAVSSGTLSGVEEEYSSGHTGRDFFWNTVGVGTWGMVFPLLTIVVTRLAGVEQAGMFSLAFITGLMLMFLANYGVRTFQVSDVSEEYTFQEYQVNRFITCIIMIVVGVGYLWIRGYENEMLIISAGVYAYKLIDGLADVYEGRLQQVDKLYLAGISQTIRSVIAVVVFSIILFVSHNLPAACVGMAVGATFTFVVVTYPLAMFETPRSKGVSAKNVWAILKLCFPLFIALFMYNLIDNMPKFLMEGRLAYENQLYFNALYFPAHSILLIAGFVYKPLLLRMAHQWADPDQRKKFDWTIVGIMAFIVVLTFVMMGIMGWIGLPIMSWLYGLDFGQFRGLCFIMLAAGGVTAAIEFIYQVITVLRRQNQLMRSYVIAFGFSLFVPILLIEFTGLPGAIIGYLIVMAILFVLLISEYVSIRLEFTHQGIEEVYKAGTYEYYQYLYEDQKKAEAAGEVAGEDEETRQGASHVDTVGDSEKDSEVRAAGETQVVSESNVLSTTDEKAKKS